MKKSWHLDRRTFLRGAGVAVATPFLSAMPTPRPARGAPRRFCVAYFPNGCALPGENDAENAQWRWFPSGEGRDFRFTNTLASLEPFRDQLTILGGLSHPMSRELLGHLAGDTFLTAGDVRGEHYKNRISVDQVAARTLGADTRYPSLVLSTDGGVGYKSRVSTMSFDDRGKPIPAESRPRSIFERYFAGGGGDSQSERKKSLAAGKRIVDLVLDDSRALERRLGRLDQQKLAEFLDSLDTVERQIERNERWLDVPLKPIDASQLELDVRANIDPNAYLDSMFALIALAFELDLTRVVTFMLGREDGMGFGDNFPNLALGIKKGHHTISHDEGAGHWPEWGRLDQWFAQRLSRFIASLNDKRDDHGSLLTNTAVLYGSACSTTHNARNYPLALLGGSGFGLKHGRYLRFDEKTPLSNLYLQLLVSLGVETESFGDSEGRLDAIVT
ncbi:MAG: DUF1552 domain-containing protein [Planctomycetota bacterium]